jgi:hypothetical protein
MHTTTTQYALLSNFEGGTRKNTVSLSSATLYLSLNHSQVALQPFVGPWSLFQFRIPILSRYDFLDVGLARRKAATYTQDSINTE